MTPLEKSELIGRRARVLTATSKTYQNLEGVIIDETREMLRLRTEKGEKSLPKKCVVLEIDGQRLAGGDIRFRPEDRIKKVRLRRDG